MIISGPYDQNFIWKIYLKIVIYIKHIFSVNNVAMTSTFTFRDEMSLIFSIPQQNTRVTNISKKQNKKKHSRSRNIARCHFKSCTDPIYCYTSIFIFNF